MRNAFLLLEVAYNLSIPFSAQVLPILARDAILSQAHSSRVPYSAIYECTSVCLEASQTVWSADVPASPRKLSEWVSEHS